MPFELTIGHVGTSTCLRHFSYQVYLSTHTIRRATHDFKPYLAISHQVPVFTRLVTGLSFVRSFEGSMMSNVENLSPGCLIVFFLNSEFLLLLFCKTLISDPLGLLKIQVIFAENTFTLPIIRSVVAISLAITLQVFDAC